MKIWGQEPPKFLFSPRAPEKLDSLDLAVLIKVAH